jgi:NAD+ synthase (glutamine-hydrolysing)
VSVRIALAQINPIVGDLAGNADRMAEAYAEAARQGADLVVFTELSVTGYPPEDLLLKPAFLRDNLSALRTLSRRLKGPAALVGFVDVEGDNRYNAAAWIENGKVAAIYRKRVLPNYGVFDEDRYFVPGAAPLTRLFKGVRVGVTICEDIWVSGPHWRQLRDKKPHIVVNLSASPFHAGKLHDRKKTFRSFVSTVKAPLLYCNAVGGQDELVFDGGSFVLDAGGRVTAEAPMFQEGVFIVEFDARGRTPKPLWDAPAKIESIDEIHEALVLGVRDYVRKNRFIKVAVGLSGGIDSALVAALASEALGPENVVGVTMPSRYNSNATITDAKKVAENLGIRFLTLPIQAVFASFTETLAPAFSNTAPNEAEENLQARIRGALLMALSNKFGWLVLTTGNKSEMSTGYCTLYGDMAGGFAVIKDVLKTTVYALSRRINERAGREVIPESTIDRAPSAELRSNQKDEDTLGAYAELDPVIVAYVEQNRSLADIVRAHPEKEAYVRRILSLIDGNEYKRRQAPPGIKITPRSFGRDHRMPITNRYRAG